MTVPTTMHAALLTGPRRIEVQRVAVPPVGPSDVLVQISMVGVCGSDVHFYEDGRVGDLRVEHPLILGHEASGRIVAVGDLVSPDRIGERVAIEPQRPCRHCRFCRDGRYNLCERMQFFSAPPVDGAFAEYLAVPDDFSYPVPDALSDAAAALIEPLSVAIAAVRSAHISAGSSVLISGAGPIGVLTAQAARAFGATRILVSDPLEARRAAAAGFGATEVLDPAHEQPPDESVDAFVDASGAAQAVLGGLRALSRGGSAVLVGMGAPTIPLDIFLLQSRELSVRGLFRYVDTWPTAIALAASGAVDLDPLVTMHLPLASVGYALEHNADEQVMKYLIEPSSDGD